MFSQLIAQQILTVQKSYQYNRKTTVADPRNSGHRLCLVHDARIVTSNTRSLQVCDKKQGLPEIKKLGSSQLDTCFHQTVIRLHNLPSREHRKARGCSRRTWRGCRQSTCRIQRGHHKRHHPCLPSQHPGPLHSESLPPSPSHSHCLHRTGRGANQMRLGFHLNHGTAAQIFIDKFEDSTTDRLKIAQNLVVQKNHLLTILQHGH